MVNIVIQARMGSTRLPGKTMMDVCGKPLLFYSIFRSKLSKYADNVIVATTNDPKDDVIVKWCEENEIPYYRGSEEDVLDRYYKAAVEFKSDLIVRVTSDCPFADPRIIDMLILIQKNLDYDYVSNRMKRRTWPHGLDVEVFTMEALEKAWKEAKLQSEREHVTPYIMNHPEKFKIFEIPYIRDLSHIRLTVDYRNDIELAKKLLCKLLNKKGIDFSWKDVLKLIENC